MELTLVFSKDFLKIESGKLEKYDSQNKKFQTLFFGMQLHYKILDKLKGRNYVEITL